ncbi:LLM class flavin-dependent oxidoreductase [Curtobacterium sp. MCPF17_052]|uniref:LLM class flavin-dependent oxidoreductase n=1 Tax=Curtobacterium sp. MCPF17_052 TaxID=2175655 RepID=UPI0024DF6D9A|nr:LLM class flavin-dependent oxidoreductase [Curtobacterium sp. MCPF17_052]WIB12475.1 LLM class flavin-dependent oxidoreductase [Curtobacterium sp. MCPF17_052]
MSRVPLSVLDLVPVSAGSTPSEALHNTVDLAREAEAAGYARYWLAEHHLNPGVAGSAPNLVMGAVAAATSSIRVGSAATLVGNVRALQIVEAFGTLVGLHGPRFDLGLGRSGAPAPGTGVRPPAPATAAARSDEVVDGLVVPAPFPFRVAPGSRFALQGELLGRVPGDVDRFADELTTIRAFLAGTFERDGVVVEATPASRPDSAPELWIHGSTGGESARIAGSLGLPLRCELPLLTRHRARFGPGLPGGVPAGRPRRTARRRVGGRRRRRHGHRGDAAGTRVRRLGALDPLRCRRDPVPVPPRTPRSCPTTSSSRSPTAWRPGSSVRPSTSWNGWRPCAG